MKRRTESAAVVTLMMWCVVAPARSAEDRRRCDQGPLTKEDFRGRAPAAAGPLALLETELRYDAQVQVFTQGNSATATLKRIDIVAYVRRDLSWNRAPTDQALLDHEQGHSDNALIESLRARQAFQVWLQQGTIFRVTAANAQEARAALERKIAAKMHEYEKAIQDAQAEYDRVTNHGVVADKQAEWRRVQSAALKQLAGKSGKAAARH